MLNQIKIMTWVYLMSAILFTNFAYAKSTEKLAIDKQGIKVWIFQSDENPVAQYRAETILNTTLENAVGLIFDTEHGKSWIPNVSEMKIVERNQKEGIYIAYMALDLPFPLTDRDLIIQSKIYREKDGRIIFKGQSIKDSRVPVKQGMVRITDYKGDWAFQKLSNNQIKVTTSGYADPAGSLPLSFVNGFVKQQPYQMLQRMKEQVKTIRYTEKDLPQNLY